MKRLAWVALLGAGVLGAGWGAYRAALAPPEPELSRFIPPGALLYLQAKDFSSLLADWDKSQEKESWLGSKNYEVFSKSRLFLRLKDADAQFSSAAGVPANANLLRQVAGRQTALALYDIGKLQFLYITRLSSGDAMQSTLWQTRSKFETRAAGGVTFFFKQDADSGREVAFAVTGDCLLLATREDLMAGALELLAGGKNPSMETEAWWSRPVAATGPVGDLRMVLNLEKIVPSPYFRSYWIQQNITDMKQYSASVSDLTRTKEEYREERTLLRKKGAAGKSTDEKGPAAVSEILRLVPASAGIYEAKANPDPKDSLELLAVKILAPHLGPSAPEKLAPQMQLGNGETGSSLDLETRVDLSPVKNSILADNRGPLRDVLANNHVLAQLQFQGTDRDPTRVFVRIHSGVVFLGESNWDEQAVRAALVEFVRPEFTSGQLGVGWKAGSGYSVLDGLWPLAVAVRGKYLLISDDAPFLSAALASMNQKSADSPAVFAAGFQHQQEGENFAALTKFLDLAAKTSAPGATPEFFSENIASLSFVLNGVSAEKIVQRDAADRQTQTVTYSWSR